ncbi:MAG: prepilin-type N-terminal cleavage/methylation domain-containing protein [Rubrivivax sp.]|nr:prepilin-type N-terminal cleavage/methylation domain-containing protein [Rubrivivax sp.]
MLTPRSRARRPVRTQRGLSLVELMVGVAVGLVIVAGAALLVASQLGENRRLLLETQVQQDLRATADIVTRELRRGGARSEVWNLIWLPDTPTALPVENMFADIDLSDPNVVVHYAYDRGGVPADNFYRYLLTNQTIRSQIGAGSPQDVTDRNTLRITAFTVQRIPLPAAQLACPNLCPDGTQDCWPTLQLEDLEVTISGQAANDPAVSRTVTSRVRLRNDAVRFNTASGAVCP